MKKTRYVFLEHNSQVKQFIKKNPEDIGQDWLSWIKMKKMSILCKSLKIKELSFTKI